MQSYEVTETIQSEGLNGNRESESSIFLESGMICVAIAIITVFTAPRTLNSKWSQLSPIACESLVKCNYLLELINYLMETK